VSSNDYKPLVVSWYAVDGETTELRDNWLLVEHELVLLKILLAVCALRRLVRLLLSQDDYARVEGTMVSEVGFPQQGRRELSVVRTRLGRRRFLLASCEGNLSEQLQARCDSLGQEPVLQELASKHIRHLFCVGE
jgi:hypothetical protein